MRLGCWVRPDSPLRALLLQQALLSVLPVLRADNPDLSAGRLLLVAEGPDSAYSSNTWLGWFRRGAVGATTQDYDSLCLRALQFQDGRGSMLAEYSLSQPYCGLPLRQIVEACASPGAGVPDEQRPAGPGAASCARAGTLLRAASAAAGGAGWPSTLRIGPGPGPPGRRRGPAPAPAPAAAGLLRGGGGGGGGLGARRGPFASSQGLRNASATSTSPFLGIPPSARIYGIPSSACDPAATSTSWRDEEPAAAEPAARRLTEVPGAGIIGGVVMVLALLLVICVSRWWLANRGEKPCCCGICPQEASKGPRRRTGKVPWYWNDGAPIFDINFSKVVYVNVRHFGVFKSLLSSTYVAKATQDRRCPEVECQGIRTPGGCEHVRPGARWFPTGYEPRQVLRVENARRFRAYLDRRDLLQALHPEDQISPGPKTSQIVDQNASLPLADRLFMPLRKELNEVYLFHGTTVRKALAIAKGNFDLGRAGEASGSTMFGDGVYFCESSTKADEHARDEPEGGYYHGVYAILICRVCLGNFYRATEADSEAMRHQVLRAGAKYQSILGDRRAAAGTFREFVVGSTELVYPEYIILYTRAGGAFYTPTGVITPLRTQVPIYWDNFHRNPHEGPGFDNRLDPPIVGREIVTLLEGFARETAGLRGIKEQLLRLTSARRIEVAASWLAYMDSKKRVRESGKGVAKCPGRPVLTQEKAMSPADGLSVFHLDQRLNEHWLWHGTYKGAAEEIARHGFQEGSEVGFAHGSRFGAGVYFAEDLALSLRYAPADAEGNVHVFLCRVVCGDFVPVEDGSRDPSGVDCLLASPPGQCRQFVVKAAQVYPEYYLRVWKP